MRFIIATIAVVLVATVKATSYGGLSNVYLPPVSVHRPVSYTPVISTNYRPAVQHVARPHNVYLPPASTHRHVVHSAPIVDYHPAVSHQRVYSAPIVDYRPAVSHQRVYNAPIADYRPVVQHVARPDNVYLPPVNVDHPVVHSSPVVASTVVRPHNTYLPPAGIDLRSGFADRR